MTPTVKKALAFATKAHDGQKRKYDGRPYIVHPIAVMQIVATVAHTEAMLMAALLHDTVEDTSVTLEDVQREFGDDVATLVEMLTDASTPDMGNRKIRKEFDRQHTAKASPAAKTIKLADLLHNSESIIAHDKGFAVTYLREKALLLKVLTEGDPVLYAQAQMALKEGLLAIK